MDTASEIAVMNEKLTVFQNAGQRPVGEIEDTGLDGCVDLRGICGCFGFFGTGLSSFGTGLGFFGTDRGFFGGCLYVGRGGFFLLPLGARI